MVVCYIFKPPTERSERLEQIFVVGTLEKGLSIDSTFEFRPTTFFIRPHPHYNVILKVSIFLRNCEMKAHS